MLVDILFYLFDIKPQIGRSPWSWPCKPSPWPCLGLEGMNARTCSCKLATCRLPLNVSAYNITSVHRSSAVQAWLACDTDRE